MKKIVLAITSSLAIAGCASNDIGDAVNNGVNGAINGVLGSVGAGDVVKNDKSFKVEREVMYTTSAKKMSRDYGTITITKTEKNPKSQTELVLQSCTHPLIGAVECEGSLFEVTSEGWLVDKPIFFDDGSWNDISLAAGKYYFKMETEKTGRDYYVAGEAVITPFVTNYVSLIVE
ncbi:TPA: hypothetical protein AB5B17_003607 [Vibrio mimicus]